MRISHLKPFRLAATLAIVISAVVPTFAQTPETAMDKAAKDAVLERMGSLVLNSCYVPGVDFSKWPDFLAKDKEAIDKAETESQFAEAINRELSSFFGISHIVLVTPRSAKARVERKVVGVGIQVMIEAEGLRIAGVFPGTPAEKAGLEVGDLITEADGKKLTTATGMLGEEGTTVQIKVTKYDGKVKTYKLLRQKYSNVREDTVTMSNPSTAVMTVHTFDTAYNRDKIDELFDKVADKPNLVVDLRGNGGGIVMNMLHFIGHLLPPETGFGTFITRNMVRRYTESTAKPGTDLKAVAQWADQPLRARTGATPFKGNVAVLVNGGTGSASEITAMALKEFRNAPVIGTKSAGAVLVSVMAPLTNGWVLQYPLMDYVSAQGVRLEANGIEPDVQAQTPRPKETDTAIEKAISMLSRLDQMRKDRGGKDGQTDSDRKRGVAVPAAWLMSLAAH